MQGAVYGAPCILYRYLIFNEVWDIIRKELRQILLRLREGQIEDEKKTADRNIEYDSDDAACLRREK